MIGDEERINALIALEENSKLIEFLMHGHTQSLHTNETDVKKNTALYMASFNGYVEIVTLLLNIFSEEKEKLIEYVMKEDDDMNVTALHLASLAGYEGIVKLLLNIFNEKENNKLIEFVMKEEYNNYTALHMASFNGHEEIV